MVIYYRKIDSFIAMNEESYFNVRYNSNYRSFIFISNGRHGDLIKMVRFRELKGRKNIFNLSLGTVLPDGRIDYPTTSNNGDRNKIIATVVQITYAFFEKYPEHKIYLTGNDTRRTLLYQRAIIYGYEELIRSFNIYGEISMEDEEDEFELFDKSKTYTGFLIEKK